MMPWIMGAALMRAGGEAWVQQLRAAQVVQEAAWRQMRVLLGVAPPVGVVNLCVPSGPARTRARRKLPEPDVEDVPV